MVRSSQSGLRLPVACEIDGQALLVGIRLSATAPVQTVAACALERTAVRGTDSEQQRSSSSRLAVA